jgi:hypothetical protein
MSEWDGVFTEIPSFQPELISAPELRAKVRSSGYGTAVAEAKPRVDRDPNEPTEQDLAEMTFQPNLTPSKLRTSAKSSGYGKKLPIRHEKEPETPPFRPQIARTGPSSKWYNSARSSKYGRKTAEAPRPKTAPAPSFRPRLSVKSRTSSVKSSGYGKQAVPPRPNSAAASRSNGFDSSPAKQKYVSRYTLLKDRPEMPEPEPEDTGFKLDGVATVNSMSRLHEAFPLEPHTPGSTQSKLKQKARSSHYGIVLPEQALRPEQPAVEPRFDFSRSNSALNVPL